MMNRLFLAMLTGFVLTMPAYGAADDMNAQTRAKAQQAVDAGLKFLKSKQAANGSIANSVGLRYAAENQKLHWMLHLLPPLAARVSAIAASYFSRARLSSSNTRFTYAYRAEFGLPA